MINYNVKYTYTLIRKKIKIFLTKKILDITESKTSFFYRVISKNDSLNKILENIYNQRKYQRKHSIKNLNKRKKPKHTDIKLSSIVYVIPFEYENFDQLKLAFEQLVPNNKRTFESINQIINMKDNIGFRNWIDFRYVAGKEDMLFGNKVKQIKNSPKNIENIELSYTRIMPSFSIFILKFNLSDLISTNINNLQNNYYLSDIEFNNFSLFKKHSFTIKEESSNNNQAEKEIYLYKNKIEQNIKKWTIKNFKLKASVINNSFFIDLYNIYGNPIKKNDLKEWIKCNKNWLNDYGCKNSEFFEKRGFYNMYSTKSFFSFDPHTTNNDNITRAKLIDGNILSRAITGSINSIIQKYSLSLEDLRNVGFNNLQKRNSKILNTNLPIEQLQISIMLINRLKNELQFNKKDIKYLVSEIGTPHNIYNNTNKNNPSKTMIKNIFNSLNELEVHFEILNKGLITVLSVENIKKIYSLQKIVIVITIVSLIISGIGIYMSYDKDEKTTSKNLNNQEYNKLK